MGGGAAMRTVAGRLIGMGALKAEHPFAAAAKKAATGARPVGGGVISSDECTLIANSDEKREIEDVQRPYWELEGWELAGHEELFSDGDEKGKLGRVVFGGAPSAEEAKEATEELKDVIEKSYLSPLASPKASRGLLSSFSSGKESGGLSLSNSGYSSDATVTSAPSPAVQAFRLLHESPVAQSVVASIACDPNVWNAVLQNKELVGYLQAHKTSFADPEAEAEDNAEDSKSPNWFDESSVPKKPASGNGFMDVLENIKHKIETKLAEMMTTLSETFQAFFGAASPSHDDGSSSASYVEKAVGASLMGLAVMVIMLVVLKRS